MCPRDGGLSFQVMPTLSNIDSLKKAIKAELHPELAHVAACRISVYESDVAEPCDPEASIKDEVKYEFKWPEMPANPN